MPGGCGRKHGPARDTIGTIRSWPSRPGAGAPGFAFELRHGAVSPHGLVHGTYVRKGEVKTATVGEATQPSPAELARREKPQREG